MEYIAAIAAIAAVFGAYYKYKTYKLQQSTMLATPEKVEASKPEPTLEKVKPSEPETTIEEVEPPKPEPTPEPTPVQTPDFYVPFRQNLQLRSHEEWVKKIRGKFDSSRSVVVSQGAAVCGQGGIGKTAMAVEYAYEFSGEYPGGVYWLNMEGGVASAVQGWIGKVKGFDVTLENLAMMNEDAVITLIVEYINPRLLTLVILDNLEMYDVPEGMVFTNAHMLVTTRRQSLTLASVDMDTPDNAGAFEMFMAYGRFEADTLDDEAKAMIQSICRAVGNLPVALEIYGALARKVPLSGVEKRAKGDAVPIKATSCTKEQGSVASALDLARHEFKGRHTLDCMLVTGYLSPENIDAQLIAQVLELDAESTEASLEELADISILKLGGNGYAIHRLTQDAARLLDYDSRIGKKTAQYLQDRAEEAMSKGVYLEAMHLIPHMLHIASFARDDAGFDDFPAVQTIGSFSTYVRYTGSYSQAEVLARSCVNRAKNSKGYESTEHAEYLNDLAVRLYFQGKYHEAEDYYRQAMEIDEKTIGREHPEYAIRLNNLASVLQDQGKYQEAEDYYRQAIEIDEKTIGGDHPQYASHLFSLADLLENQKRFDEAKPLYEQAIEIFNKTLGQDHPNTKNCKAFYERLLRKMQG